MGTYKSVPRNGRSGNLRGTETIVTSNFQGLAVQYFVTIY